MKNTRGLWRIFRKRLSAVREDLPRLIVSAGAQEFIEREVADFRRDVETGGILMGRIESETLIRVTHASGPGPGAIHTPSHFLRDTAYCAGVLQEHYEKFGIDYVGEWHSHVGSLKKPSAGDLVTLSRIMGDPDYDFTIFAMLLAVAVGKRRPKIGLHGFIATREEVLGVTVEDETPE